MSDIDRDPNWNAEANRVANQLDHNDVGHAQESMRRDLFQLQNDPHAQHEFINMVNNYDHKGIGADLNVYRDQNGREQWQISPPNYGGERPMYPPPAPMYPPPEVVPYPVPVQPNPGEVIGGAIIGGVIGGLIGGGDRHRRW